MSRIKRIPGPIPPEMTHITPLQRSNTRKIKTTHLTPICSLRPQQTKQTPPLARKSATGEATPRTRQIPISIPPEKTLIPLKKTQAYKKNQTPTLNTQTLTRLHSAQTGPTTSKNSIPRSIFGQTRSNPWTNSSDEEMKEKTQVYPP